MVRPARFALALAGMCAGGTPTTATAAAAAAAPPSPPSPPPPSPEQAAEVAAACEELVHGPAHPAAVRNDDVENQLEYLTLGSAAPEVFQGIYWMDQTGYYQTRPDRPDQAGQYEVVNGKSSWYNAFPHNLPSAAPELLLSFGPSAYNVETRCMGVSLRTDQWLWANTTGTAAGSITWADVTAKGFFQFCFDEAMREISVLQQPCNGDGDFGTTSTIDDGKRIIPRPWGLERLNRRTGEIVTRYAAYQIVDGLGQRTRHYQAWLDFMQAPCWFTPRVPDHAVPFWNDTSCRSQGGWHVNAGGGYSVLGRRGPA